jgi:endonuclease G, mitochondrial
MKVDFLANEIERQQRSAAERVADRAESRRERVDTLRQPGGLVKADTPGRIAARIDRLSHYHPDVRPISPLALAAEEPEAMASAGAVLERIINTDDLLGVGYLEGGASAARAVCRINIKEAGGRLVGFGTGTLVSQTLLLTNHHVLPTAEIAASSIAEFDFQDGVDGLPITPRSIALSPEQLFLTDEELDYSLVAVRATPQELADFGSNRLIEAEGKAIVGDFVSIIQHPGGEKKQVALRENRIVDLLDSFLHYETDTEPGSSGSPVFSDQWEVVALHHASVPAPDDTELGGIVNEGVRVSSLLRSIRARSLSPAEGALVEQLFPESAAPPAEGVSVVVERDEVSAPWLTVPLEIRLGTQGVRASQPSYRLAEAVTIDPDYAGRRGFDPAFLGAGDLEVPLPTLPDDLVPLASINAMATSEPRYVLPYHHFSVVMNKNRRLAFFTAVNIDGGSSIRVQRETDRWSFDPRLPEEEQTGEEAYRDNPLDRGHLIRRLDPAWGDSIDEAKLCNDDTFHFTNCTPQHEDFNQSQSTWAGLEDYILDNADNRDFKVSVFTGPILADDDQAFRNIQLPRQFWKVVVMVKEDGGLSVTGYLLSQEGLIQGLEFVPEEFSYGAYETFQVPVRSIEELTRLSFGSLSDADPLGQIEAAVPAMRVDRPEQLVF